MRTRALTWAFAAFGAAACTSVIGIEDLEPGLDVEATGGRSATGGGGATDGGDPGITGGRAPTGGSAQAGATTGGAGTTGGAAPTGGTTGDAGAAIGGASDAGSTGEGGAATAEPITVSGKVIDFWGHVLPSVPIDINGERPGVTDTAGTFTFEDITPPYDVTLFIDTERGNYGWVFQGLTRENPTLQVGVGFDSRETPVTFHATNAEFDEDNQVSVVLGSDDGSFALSLSGPDTTSYPTWYGPEATDAIGHALWWTESDAGGGPTAYLGYGTTTTTLSDGIEGDLTLDLSQYNVDSEMVEAEVTREGDFFTNMMFLRFDDNSVIELADEYMAENAFSFLAPRIPNSEVTIAAANGDYGSGPYGVAYGVAADAPVTLATPVPPTVISPAPNLENVDKTTVFQWTDTPGVHVLHIEDDDFYQGIFIVTDKTSVTIPDVVGGFSLRRGGIHYWLVEVHGTAQNVDEATGPEGFLDPFYYYRDSVGGPRRGAGSYAFTQLRGFTAAP